MKSIFKHYWIDIKHHKTSLIIMIVGMMAVVALETAMPFFIRDFVNAISQNDIVAFEAAIIQILKILALFYFGFWVIWRINEFAVTHFESKIMRALDRRAFDTLQKQSMRFFENSFTGSLVKKVGRFVGAFESLTDVLYFNLLHTFFSIVVIFIVFLREKPLFGLLFLLWAIVFLGGNYVFSLWKMKYDILAAASDSKVGATMADSLGNHSTVKSFAQEYAESERFQKTLDERFRNLLFTWHLQNYANLVQALFMILFEFSLFYFSYRWWKAGNFRVGDFIFFQTYLIELFRNIWDFGRHIQRMYKNIANAKEMVEIFENEVEVQDAHHARDLQVHRGEIEFRNVTFSFEREELFKNFSLKIQAGEKVALVGPSGAGKSTITKLLFRFFDPQSGDIFIDGQNIRNVTQKSLRERIALVPQSPELFHRTLAENIAFGKGNATPAEIRSAAKLAHADEFIALFPKKYETYVGERGVKLSGGERQRVAIARAFLKNAPIVILDEATSALDSITEKKIQSALRALMQDRTAIVIAHRLSTILAMDRIIVIDDGSIVEGGTHQELLEREGLYFKLWTHQTGGFIE